ncbi:MAG: T9SS type A sorting domain-containing protein, partial [Crocinitomicaceae bacterium]|nr:T9SS type A sorting domain-containing protein [Crocinitomicaceae bacterium]
LGCIAEDNGTILNPTALNITSVSTTTTGVGTSTGTATLSTTGGQAPYTYSINGTTFAGSATFTNLAAGSYTAYVEDANGCSDQMSFYINENACDFGLNFSADSVSCQGMCDGVLNFDFSGSTAETPFYVELFKDGNLVDASVYTIPTISDYYTGMCVGIYTLSVMSSSGCKQFAVTEIEAPLQMNLAAETETATVYASNGSVLLFANGGTPPYQYSIDDQTTWQSNSQFDNLYSDNYMAWVEDVNGCLAATSVFVPDTATCTSVITLQTTNVSCPEDCDGTITVIFNDTGNNPNYVINLYQGSLLVDTSIVYTTFSGLFEFTGLCEGAYQLHVVDEDGCADVQPVYIHSTDSMHVSDIIITESTPGNADGSAELILQGGTAPFLFTIDDGNTWNPENYFGNLNNGSYTTMIKDDHDCIFIYQFTVNDFPGCNINTTFDLTQPISCYDSCDAIITYSFSDALNNPPYTLDLMMNTLVYETQVHTTNSFTGVWDTLCLGFYSIRVTDGNGCQSEMPYVTVTRPADLTLDLLVTDALPGQSNGLVNLLSSGGTGQHTYSLDAVNYQTQTSYEDLMPGNYLAYVMDENFCEDTASFIITENSACDLALSFLTDDLMTCPGDCNGAISFEYTDPGLNNAPYSVKLMDQTGSILATAIGTTTNETGIFMNLCAGNYKITVEDLYGCQTTSPIIPISQPDYLEVDQVLVEPFDGYYNGSITLNATGGTAPYEFSTNQTTWSTTNTWTGLNAGFYILYVRDDNGCEQVICVVLENEWVTSVLDNESDFAAYPNPTQNLIFISHHNIQLVNVYTTSGSRVEIPYTHFDNGTTVDFSNLASGIYLVEFVDADGKIMRGKVVKE